MHSSFKAFSPDVLHMERNTLHQTERDITFIASIIWHLTQIKHVNNSRDKIFKYSLSIIISSC